jgi:hypothetical protein
VRVLSQELPVRDQVKKNKREMVLGLSNRLGEGSESEEWMKLQVHAKGESNNCKVYVCCLSKYGL